MLIGAPAGDGYQRIDGVVGLDAMPREQPWRSLRESIKDAARQLEGGPPGLIAIHFTDPVEDWDALSPGPMAASVMPLIETWPHVAGVLLSSEIDAYLQSEAATQPIRAFFDSSRLPPGFPKGEPVRPAAA